MEKSKRYRMALKNIKKLNRPYNQINLRRNMSKEEVKKGLTVKDQIEYLENNKNIIFKDEQEKKSAEEYLLKYSYSDVINPLKVLFSSGYDQENKCHKYEHKTKWSEIKRLHEDIKKIEDIMLRRVLDFELELKSFFCDWLSTQIKDKHYKNFDDFIDNLEMTTIQRIKLKHKYEIIFYNNFNKEGYHDKKYEDYWWLLVSSFSFGEFNNILNSKNENGDILYLIKKHIKSQNKKSTLLKIIKGNKLNTIRILRNSLCHRTNILIYLDQPLRGVEDIKNAKRMYDERDKDLKWRSQPREVKAIGEHTQRVKLLSKLTYDMKLGEFITEYVTYKNTSKTPISNLRGFETL
jgi:hypothetical protein